MLAKLIVHARRPRGRPWPRWRRRWPTPRIGGHRDQPRLPAPGGCGPGRSPPAGTPRASLDDFAYRPAPSRCWPPGTQTTVQDWPGRLGYWDVGVPPSGPMDDLAFRLGNRLVGNARRRAGAGNDGARARRCASAPRRRVALTGRRHGRATLDGAPVPWWRPIAVPAGGSAAHRPRSQAPGAAPTSAWRAASTCRTTWAAAPPSRWASSAAMAGARCGGRRAAPDGRGTRAAADGAAARRGLIPSYGTPGSCGVLYGPHGAPDFFTDDDIDDLLRHRLGSALQLQPHRRAPDRPEAGLGARPTAARPGCTPPTSTTTPMPSAPSTSPATCR